MRKIPPKLRKEMADDPYYSRCCITGQKASQVKIEWHHNLIYAGRQVNEKWCILPVCVAVHERANSPTMRDRLDWVMLNRADDETLLRFSKAVDLIKRREHLNEKYGRAYQP